MQEEQPQIELSLPRHWVFWSMMPGASMFVKVVALSWATVRVFQQAEGSGYVVLTC